MAPAVGGATSALCLPWRRRCTPQMRARRYFQEVDHPVVGRWTYPGPPFRLTDGSPGGDGWGWRAGRAPLLGEHNEEVFGELLGFERSDLVRLRAAGVV